MLPVSGASRRYAALTSALLSWRSGLTRTTFQTRPSLSISAITSPAGPALPAAQAVEGGAGEGVVVVVPGLAERRQREPEDVGRLVVDVEAPARRRSGRPS